MDHRDVNKACPKDNFLLPNMDVLVDSTSGQGILSFIDGFSGYNQIKMSSRDAEKTAFRTLVDNFLLYRDVFWAEEHQSNLLAGNDCCVP